MCPCDGSHCEPRLRERESKRVAELIVYVDSFFKGITPAWIVKAANDTYGNEGRFDELTEMLCTKCKNLRPGPASSIIYNPRSKQSRELADWWEDHQEEDRKKAADALADARRAKIRASAMSKLSKAERHALGL